MFTYFAFNNKAKKGGQQNSAEQQNSSDVIGLQNLHLHVPEDIENSQDGLPTTDEQE